MSVFNGEKYLKESIESILKQTYSDFEFIIVNDASQDGTGEILLEYQKKDNRIKIINNQTNIGLTKSLNKALKIAQGEYIARQDDDDLSLPERFEKQTEFLKKNPEIKMLGTFAHSINNKGDILREEKFPISNEEIRKAFIKRNQFIHGSVMIEKKALSKIGFYNEDFQTSQDYELWFRFLRKFKSANLPLFLVRKRYLKDMVSLEKEKTQIENGFFLKKKAIRMGEYSKLCYFYFLRIWLSSKCPLLIKKFLRKHVLKSKSVFREIYS
jgi:glycosyltransferase involved in cell wall biosynthesis